ncbi:MAG: hypothetical protein KAS93_01615 [Gammaproteobacteria bacterium]|nr:hypothetical protein [Gammaproteobacteria bacterium]
MVVDSNSAVLTSDRKEELRTHLYQYVAQILWRTITAREITAGLCALQSKSAVFPGTINLFGITNLREMAKRYFPLYGGGDNSKLTEEESKYSKEYFDEWVRIFDHEHDAENVRLAERIIDLTNDNDVRAGLLSGEISPDFLRNIALMSSKEHQAYYKNALVSIAVAFALSTEYRISITEIEQLSARVDGVKKTVVDQVEANEERHLHLRFGVLTHRQGIESRRSPTDLSLVQQNGMGFFDFVSMILVNPNNIAQVPGIVDELNTPLKITLLKDNFITFDDLIWLNSKIGIVNVYNLLKVISTHDYARLIPWIRGHIAGAEQEGLLENLNGFLSKVEAECLCLAMAADMNLMQLLRKVNFNQNAEKDVAVDGVPGRAEFLVRVLSFMAQNTALSKLLREGKIDYLHMVHLYEARLTLANFYVLFSDPYLVAALDKESFSVPLILQFVSAFGELTAIKIFEQLSEPQGLLLTEYLEGCVAQNTECAQEKGDFYKFRDFYLAMGASVITMFARQDDGIDDAFALINKFNFSQEDQSSDAYADRKFVVGFFSALQGWECFDSLWGAKKISLASLARTVEYVVRDKNGPLNNEEFYELFRLRGLVQLLASGLISYDDILETMQVLGFATTSKILRNISRDADNGIAIFEYVRQVVKSVRDYDRTVNSGVNLLQLADFYSWLSPDEMARIAEMSVDCVALLERIEFTYNGPTDSGPRDLALPVVQQEDRFWQLFHVIMSLHYLRVLIKENWLDIYALFSLYNEALQNSFADTDSLIKLFAALNSEVCYELIKKGWLSVADFLTNDPAAVTLPERIATLNSLAKIPISVIASIGAAGEQLVLSDYHALVHSQSLGSLLQKSVISWDDIFLATRDHSVQEIISIADSIVDLLKDQRLFAALLKTQNYRHHECNRQFEFLGFIRSFPVKNSSSEQNQLVRLVEVMCQEHVAALMSLQISVKKAPDSMETIRTCFISFQKHLLLFASWESFKGFVARINEINDNDLVWLAQRIIELKGKLDGDVIQLQYADSLFKCDFRKDFLLAQMKDQWKEDSAKYARALVARNSDVDCMQNMGLPVEVQEIERLCAEIVAKAFTGEVTARVAVEIGQILERFIAVLKEEATMHTPERVARQPVAGAVSAALFSLPPTVGTDSGSDQPDQLDVLMAALR